MGEAFATRYWCHVCAQIVNPVMEPEIKCPFCDNGFVEETDGGEFETDADLRSGQGLSALFGMMGGSSRRSRFQREDEDDDSDDELEEFIRRRRWRRRSSILQLMQRIRDDVRLDPDNLESERRERDRERERERERQRQRHRQRQSAILINSSNQAIIIQGLFDSDENQSDSNNSSIGASLGDYFLGSGLDQLLQHLSENDPSRYGTPPAKKEAVDALLTVKVEKVVSCPVCLDDFEVGSEVKEMPCKHKFHTPCILPWLELHSSCPVCRFQLPADESKDSNMSSNGSRVEISNEDGGDAGAGRGNSRSWVLVPWPFNGLFSASGTQNGENSSSNPSSSSTSGSNPNNDH
ncbi:E3 ubiquitin-protein ligase SIRP1-like isoform X1 [Typha angustifolia]|uniref:E3 ubiquitin-protein ligase SIRP1-like isoform X1 n=1 Tax=Typha angustifolia TaxID=59011 RepID=UPI003C2DF60D